MIENCLKEYKQKDNSEIADEIWKKDGQQIIKLMEKNK